MTTYRMYKDSERELRFPLAVAVSYQNGDRASTARSFVATWRVALLIAQRSRSNTATGSVQASKRPIAYFGKHAGSRRRVIPSCGLPSCWSRHCWRTCGWCYGGRSSPAHGRGRDLPEEFTFKTFCDWIRRELEEELRRRWKIKANGVGVPASQVTAAG